MSEAGIAWRVSPQDVDDLGVAAPPCEPGNHHPGRFASSEFSPEMSVHYSDGVCDGGAGRLECPNAAAGPEGMP